MDRIWVVGTSGSGKTTLARHIAATLGHHHIELDALHWQPGWRAMPREAFRADLAAVLDEHAAWVVDGNYHTLALDLLLARADTIVWLDLRHSLVMWRIVTRTFGRAAVGTVLWNGNRERPWCALFSADSVIRWAWMSHGPNRDRYRQLQRDWPGHFVRLRSRREVADWAATLTPSVRD